VLCEQFFRHDVFDVAVFDDASTGCQSDPSTLFVPPTLCELRRTSRLLEDPPITYHEAGLAPFPK